MRRCRWSQCGARVARRCAARRAALRRGQLSPDRCPGYQQGVHGKAQAAESFGSGQHQAAIRQHRLAAGSTRQKHLIWRLLTRVLADEKFAGSDEDLKWPGDVQDLRPGSSQEDDCLGKLAGGNERFRLPHSMMLVIWADGSNDKKKSFSAISAQAPSAVKAGPSLRSG